MEWPTPQGVRDVRSFLGLCNFYRRFVRGFSSIASPLTELTKEKKPWHWGQDEEKSFVQLKVALTTAPILVFPDFAKMFVLTTDASLVAVGAILQQDQGNGLQCRKQCRVYNEETELEHYICGYSVSFTPLPGSAIVFAPV